MIATFVEREITDGYTAFRNATLHDPPGSLELYCNLAGRVVSQAAQRISLSRVQVSIHEIHISRAGQRCSVGFTETRFSSSPGRDVNEALTGAVVEVFFTMRHYYFA